MKILIKNGHVVDSVNQIDRICDVLIQDEYITKVDENIQENVDQIIDAKGKYVLPGFIDLHVHFRDPGLEYKETLETGGNAAVRGGVTTVCAMPNTIPAIDTKELVESVMSRALKESKTRVIQLGAITAKQAGKELADIKGMAEAGCHAISDDGRSVMNASLYRASMKIAKEENIAIFAHCEDETMVEAGVMNAGDHATSLGLKGITNSVEDVIVARDILLAKETGAQLHLCHCSTADSVTMINEAKKAGLAVTGEVCPHHFILTAEDIEENHGRYKMNPPLRSKEDVEALKMGLKNNIMDAISTDHAPHSDKEKECTMDKAAFGIVGLETLATLTYTALVEEGYLTMIQMVEKLSTNPAKILGLTDRGIIGEGMLADLVIFDPNVSYCIDKFTFASKGKNTPFHGYPVKGDVITTLVGGKIVYKN